MILRPELIYKFKLVSELEDIMTAGNIVFLFHVMHLYFLHDQFVFVVLHLSSPFLTDRQNVRQPLRVQLITGRKGVGRREHPREESGTGRN